MIPTVRLAACSLLLFASFVARAEEPLGRNVTLRGKYANSLHRFAEGRGHVAFIGGSITEMNGYRPMIAEWLAKRFPRTEFTFTNAGISSTCSTTGAMRLERDVLAPREGVPDGGVDLLFVEFAVNDDQDAAHANREAMRGMEGILRHARRACPNADVVVTYFVNPGMLELITKGETPVSIAAHEKVAEHYGVSTVYLAREVADRIEAGSLTWKDYGGTHPKPAGNRIAADLNIALLQKAWSAKARPTPHALPERHDPNAYDAGQLVTGDAAKTGDGWVFAEPEWKSIRGSLRPRFAGRKLLVTETLGNVATLEFEGRGVGAYVLAGPDAGIVEARIDGGEWKQVDLYHRFSKGLHYPRTVMFFADLEPGEHTLEARMSGDKNPASQGHAIRLLAWAVNGNP